MFSGSAVRAGAGQDDANAGLCRLICKRSKKEIDRRFWLRLLRWLCQAKATATHREIAVRRRDVNGIGFGLGSVLYVPNRRGRFAAKQPRHHAAVCRRQMLDNIGPPRKRGRCSRQHFGNDVLRWIKGNEGDAPVQVVPDQKMQVRCRAAIAMDQTDWRRSQSRHP